MTEILEGQNELNTDNQPVESIAPKSEAINPDSNTSKPMGFTQAQVNSMIASERRSWEQKAKQDLDARETKLKNDFESKFKELEESFKDAKNQLSQKDQDLEKSRTEVMKAEQKIKIFAKLTEKGVRPDAFQDIVSLVSVPVDADESAIEKEIQNFLEKRPYLKNGDSVAAANSKPLIATNPSSKSGVDLSWHPLVKSSKDLFG